MKAVATARSGRQGPVFLSLPLDVASERVPPMRASTQVSTNFKLDEAMLSQAAEALHKAERGMILVGSGARHPEAVRWVGTLASTLQMPVATTPKAKGIFPESDTLSLGIFGFGGHKSATDYLEQGIDTLLCIGCGLGETGTNSWSPILQPSKTFIQIDIDAGQIGKNYQIDYGIVGPSHIVLRELASRIRRKSGNPVSSGIKYIEPENAESNELPLRPARAIRLLQDAFPEDTVYTLDIGEHTMFALHYLRIDHPDAFMVSTGLGSMGSGVASAVGAKVAMPKRPVVSICGDFGFQMLGMELATCVQSQIGVVFAIFNDGRMRMVESGQTKVFGRTGPMHAPKIDFAAMATAMGAHGIRVEKPSDFAVLREIVRDNTMPIVLDIDIDPKAMFPIHGRIAQIRNFNSQP
jgi:acetolactate synthase-1/2/3 large subunit